MTGLIFLAAAFGAYFDWRYRRLGGLKSTRRDKQNLGAAVVLSVAGLVALWFLGGRVEGITDAATLVTSVLFGLWEFARWRIRRANPIVPR
jgi:uncharacterized membrane protein SpoIIM required for sporulation